MLAGSGHLVAPCDVISQGDRSRLIETIAEAWDGLDVLVNNAGVLAFGPLSTLTDDTLASVVTTNLFAPIAVTRDVLPLLQRGSRPQIVNIGSLLGSIPYPLFSAYSASKAGLHAFSTSLRRELGSRGITVAHVAPRATATAAAGGMVAYSKPLDMRFDAPEIVARYVWDGIAARHSEIFPRGQENLFVLAQKLVPAQVDKAVAKQLARARMAGLPT